MITEAPPKITKPLSKRLNSNKLETPPLITTTSLESVFSACQRVLARWPNIIPDTDEKDRENLIRLMLNKLKTNDWEGIKISKVTAAARVAFSPEFRARVALTDLLSFFIEETSISTSTSLMSAMMHVYLESFEADAPHTHDLANALSNNRANVGAKWDRLISSLPQLFYPQTAHLELAKLMYSMDDPWQELKTIGFTNPHAPGLTDHAHIEFSELIKPELKDLETIRHFMNWLKPDGQPAKASGTTQSIEALLSPWLNIECPSNIRDHLTESLLLLFGDPRLGNSTRWAQVGSDYIDLMLRWLTRADMQFFIGVVDATQPSHMWKPRREFWMRLYNRRRIDAAWVAYSDDAADYAARNLMDDRSLDTTRRFGRQIAGGTRKSTSILIMKIGQKIVVDGCHNYKTHIFDQTEINAPKLYQRYYDCERIRLRSRLSKPHNSISNWQDWVEEHT